MKHVNARKVMLLSFTGVAMLTALVGCGGSSDSNVNPPTVNPNPQFSAFKATAANGGGEILIDSVTKLTWVNDKALDTRGFGCLNPSMVGPIAPSEANARCDIQQFAGFTDWRAPTAEELSKLVKDATATGTKLNYLAAACGAVIGSNGIVRTENTNPIAASNFPAAKAGDIFTDPAGSRITTLAGLSGLPAGVRCVRGGTEKEPAVAQSTRLSSMLTGASETLLDKTTGLEWINDTQVDAKGNGCLNPAVVGKIEPSQANARCIAQGFAGHSDWRAPTVAELAVLTRAAITERVTLKYINAACPALVGTDGIIRTENANPAASTKFPNAQPGDQIAVSLSELGSGVNAGVRCVRKR